MLTGLLADTSSDDPAGRDLVVRFQQVCGPVMAKGVEDTTFYRWHRLIALNEVGGDPRVLDSPDVALLHTWAAEQVRDHPAGMTGLSTHDTKRSEDVRARLLGAVENLEGWDQVTREVLREAATCDIDVSTAYLLAQTLIGSWPIEAERLSDYLEKAVREAKLFTTWNDPNDPYEQRIMDLADCLPLRRRPAGSVHGGRGELSRDEGSNLGHEAPSAHAARSAGRLPGHGAGHARRWSTRTTDGRSTSYDVSPCSTSSTRRVRRRVR